MGDSSESALHIQPGCETPEPPRNLARHASGQRLSLKQCVDGIRNADRSILARAITLVESSREPDRELAEQIVEACLVFSGESIRVGITGVPGAGKSSVIETLGTHLIDKHNQKVAVLAVDPSSQISGGSILGDKTRMVSLAASEHAFIRPSPSRGSLGGVAQRTREAILLCEAAGYECILVETVGVGQSETVVHGMVDFFMLVALTGAGDELQGIKRGIMELANLVVINKADGDNIQAANRARSEAENALHFFPATQSGWTQRALACSALTGAGIPELWDCVLDHAATTRSNGWFDMNRQSQAKRWMRETVQQALMLQFESHPMMRAAIESLENEVMAGQTSSFRAARSLLKMYSSLVPNPRP